MAQADLDQPRDPVPIRGRSPWIRGMACVAMLPLLGFIGQTGHSLWGEWASLKRARAMERASTIVGYVNITPNPNYASRPDNWSHDEGDAAVLWSGWRGGENHWFRYGRGEIDVPRLSLPIGRDVIQAIDRPIFEQGGGKCWDRILEESHVIGIEGSGGARSYPLVVLEKVEVVNDRTGDRALLLVHTPVEDIVSVFEANLDGKDVTMGHSGYFLGHRPVVYDRETESLWSERDGSMVALTGRHKGATLKPIGKFERVAWSDWKSRHPQSRLLIGADRSRARPVD